MRIRTKGLLRRLKYRSHRIDGHAGYQWSRIHHNRMEIINRAVAAFGSRCRYLEIGCDSDVCFNSIAASEKVGVDPDRGGTIRATSDAFFEENTETFDVIFIDGLHEYRQVRKDAMNALDCLTQGGLLFFHDLLPNTWEEAHIPPLVPEWTGDVWKIAHELAITEGISFATIIADHGVGVARKLSADVILADLRPHLDRADFSVYLATRSKMNPISFEQYVDMFLNPPR